MNNEILAQLYAEHTGKVSDKWSIYLAEYDRIFSEYRTKPIRMLEIGIQNGGSLEIWPKYFPNGEKFIGCDINPACSQLRFDDLRIALVVGDANTDNTQSEILQLEPEFDIVIDDGSHLSSDIVKSFARYFPKIVDGGVFVSEDIHCSYWHEYEGGLFHPFSAITFFKHLADIINHEHWGVQRNRSNLLKCFSERYEIIFDENTLKHVHSIEFINSICIVRKCAEQKNLLGPRFIAGNKEDVATGHDAVRGSTHVPPPQVNNYWSTRDLPPSQELLVRRRELKERDNQIIELNRIISIRDRKIEELILSIAQRDG